MPAISLEKELLVKIKAIAFSYSNIDKIPRTKVFPINFLNRLLATKSLTGGCLKNILKELIKLSRYSVHLYWFYDLQTLTSDLKIELVAHFVRPVNLCKTWFICISRWVFSVVPCDVLCNLIALRYQKSKLNVYLRVKLLCIYSETVYFEFITYLLMYLFS